MPQTRVMGDDRGHVESVVQKLRALIADHGMEYGLFVGDATQLTHRGGGGRFVFDLTDLGYACSPGRDDQPTHGAEGDVIVERVDSVPARQQTTRPRGELPPGGGR